MLNSEESAPQELIRVSDLKGETHFHLKEHGQRIGEFTGSHDSVIEDEAFIDWVLNYLPGFEYIVVTDHLEQFDRDRSRFHPGDKYGVEHLYNDTEIIQPQLKRVRVLDKYYQGDETRMGIRVIAGVEASIQRSGQINATGEVLNLFDVVIASEHYYQTGGTPEEMTRRYLTALKNPRVDILGHPARNYDAWKAIDWNEIAVAAREADKAIEINMTPTVEYNYNPTKIPRPEPSRQLEILKILAHQGVKVSIGGDTHKFLSLKENTPVQFRQLYDLAKLVRDLNDLGFQKSQLVNTLPSDQLIAWAKGNNH